MTNEEVLFHFNALKPLYVFIDAFKKFRFGVAVYQLIDGSDAPFQKVSLRLILYISRNLN